MLNISKKEMIESFRVRCKQHNLSMTPQRLAIYSELIKCKNHPDSEEIYNKVRKHFPDISLDTVYRTLSKFSEIGIASLVEGYGETKRYDPDTSRHHHLRCLQCNKIVDFYNDGFSGILW